MVTKVITCYHCGSERLVKNGHDPHSKQRYLCRACGRANLDDPAPVGGYSEAEKAWILRAYEKRSSLRALARTFGVSRNTVSAWLKKSPEPAAARRDPARTLPI